jgi:hypothetical protein
VEEKIYVISCNQELESMGMDRRRMAMDGLGETKVKLDWSNASLLPVVSQEKVQFQVGETRILSIRSISVPAFSIVIQSFYGSNGMGHLSCIGSTEFKPFTDERVANKAMFQSRIKAAVMKGDLLGQVLVVPAKRA